MDKFPTNSENTPLSVFWFRRDLRIDDNVGLYHALKSEYKVLPLFIFDTDILDELPKDDARVSFIYSCLNNLNAGFANQHAGLRVEVGKPVEVLKRLIQQLNIKAVYTNSDYEPYGIDRDAGIKQCLLKAGVSFFSYKDHVIREPLDILKKDGKPYTIYTPYSNKWLEQLNQNDLEKYDSKALLAGLMTGEKCDLPSLESLGFVKNPMKLPAYKLNATLISNYEKDRNIPGIKGTSHLGLYLRFGTLSVREVIRQVGLEHPTFIKQLIWREFFMQILYNFRHVVHASFKNKYDNIKWENNEAHFAKWCQGETGYAIVDAGMKELNQTGYMHNRVRMVTASFLCKHLLIDWRWGEAYFANKLLDYELASNNGNWQWASGSGCDAAPYFRIFNPYTQQQKFDPDFAYIKKWIPEYHPSRYIAPIVDHKEAREKALIRYKQALTP